jgi:hypothetical protein
MMEAKDMACHAVRSRSRLYFIANNTLLLLERLLGPKLLAEKIGRRVLLSPSFAFRHGHS